MLEAEQHEFVPNWFSKPADSLLSLMNRRGVSIETVASEIDGGMETMRGLVMGTQAIDSALASSLSATVGGSPIFWLKRQEKYEQALDFVLHKVSDELDEWLKHVPVFGSKPRGRLSDAQKKIELRKRLAFYEVNNLESWYARYGQMRNKTQFRASQTFSSKDGAISLWLRQGELEAALTSTQKWNPEKLRNSLSSILGLSKIRHPARFLPKLKALAAEAGVAIVVVKAPNGCRASGASRLVTSEKAMVLLSFRHLSDDHFWFTLLHEFGHLLLHNAESFVDSDDTYQDEREQEANNFARACVIPVSRWEEFIDLRCDKNSVMRFSVSLGIAAGLVVGQLQHRQTIPRDRLNFLKRRWKWDEIEAGLK